MRYASITTHKFRDPRFILLQAQSISDMNALQDDLDAVGAKFLAVAMDPVLARVDTNLLKPRTPSPEPTWLVVDAAEASLFVVKYAGCIQATLDQEEIEDGLDAVKSLAKVDRLRSIGTIFGSGDANSISLIYAKIAMVTAMQEVESNVLDVDKWWERYTHTHNDSGD